MPGPASSIAHSKYVKQEFRFALQSLSALRSHGDDSTTISYSYLILLYPVFSRVSLPPDLTSFFPSYHHSSHIIFLFHFHFNVILRLSFSSTDSSLLFLLFLFLFILLYFNHPDLHLSYFHSLTSVISSYPATFPTFLTSYLFSYFSSFHIFAFLLSPLSFLPRQWRNLQLLIQNSAATRPPSHDIPLFRRNISVRVSFFF